MSARFTRSAAAVTALGLALTLALTAGAPSTAAPRDRAASPAQQADRAQQALAAAQALFDATPAARDDRAAGPRDATLVLRDLVAHRAALTGADRAAADRVLARPSTTQRKCTKRICVHWKPSQVSAADANHNGVSDYIDRVVKTVDNVHVKYRKAGYRSPKSDRGRGGDNRPDIYIKNVGAQGLYGYCTSDERIPRGQRTGWAYCVLDNNYSHAEFPTNTPLENMQVTAAHEYFHAVQFNYDLFENGWFLEATATWAEDEVFDSVNDNVYYLSLSPLTRPDVPLNTFGSTFHYGTWIFFRFLTEKFTASDAGMPVLVRSMWRKAPRSKSLTLINRVLGDKGTSLKKELTRFADANLRPQQSYVEGDANDYPGPDLWRNRVLTQASPAFAGSATRDHLASASARFTPSGLNGGPWELTVRLNLPPTDRGSAAIVTVHYAAQPDATTLVPLNDNGNASIVREFSSGIVDSVEVTMVNGSTSGNNRTLALSVEAMPTVG